MKLWDRSDGFPGPGMVRILTDDVSDLPRSAFLQLGENVGLERQSGNSKEKLGHVVPCRRKTPVRSENRFNNQIKTCSRTIKAVTADTNTMIWRNV